MAEPAPSPEVLPESLGRRYLAEFDTAELDGARTDVLVIGSGIAGLTAALEASARGMSVTLISKSRVSETNTWYAQGGIAGAVGEADSVELHVADTLEAGAGLCEEEVVRTITGEAAQALSDLQEHGVRFDRADSGAIALAREGGHSLPRVVHAGDATGAEVQDRLSAAIRRAKGVSIAEEHYLVDLLTAGDRCIGALVLDPAARALKVFNADATVLATGGCGQLYRVTTNPEIATGDGVASAWRAGAEIADLEFVQFHPTALDSCANPKSLISEALRGEGAYLLDCEEKRFMVGVHPLAELAPRDIVTREIERVMARCGRPNVWLDARHIGEATLKARFPTIWESVKEAGFDLARDLVPVAPAAHYMVGGVRVDIDGRTSLEGLYASGEASASGLHGANRLASNSLLEGLVLSRRIVRDIAARGSVAPVARVSATAAEGKPVGGVERAVSLVRDTMTTFVGVSRSEGGLREAAGILGSMSGLLDLDVRMRPEYEMQDLYTIAALLTWAARYRKESRGAHWREDHPSRDDEHWRSHVVWRRGSLPKEVPVGRFAHWGDI